MSSPWRPSPLPWPWWSSSWPWHWRPSPWPWPWLLCPWLHHCLKHKLLHDHWQQSYYWYMTSNVLEKITGDICILTVYWDTNCYFRHFCPVSTYQTNVKQYVIQGWLIYLNPILWLVNKKLSCCREVAQRSTSLKSLLNHSRSFEITPLRMAYVSSIPLQLRSFLRYSTLNNVTCHWVLGWGHSR